MPRVTHSNGVLRMLHVHVLLFIFNQILHLKCNELKGGSRIDEYCDTEVFRAECSEGELLILDKARYGRMRIGRCVEFPMGSIGCSADVLRLADRRCSGRRVCELRVPDAEFEGTQPCLKELKTYLEASYTCIKVEMVQNSNCKMVNELNVTSSTSGYLASIVSPDVYHCNADVIGYRWVIRGRPLQRINLTLYDFSFHPPPSPNPTYAVANAPVSPPRGGGEGEKIRVEESSIVERGRGRCRRDFGLIEDIAPGRPLTTTIICPSSTTTNSSSSSSINATTDRISHLYLSEGNVVRIWLPNDVARRHDNYDSTPDRFLIHYAVIGCAFPTLPEQTWFKSEGNSMGIIGCKHANMTWPVECQGDVWNISSTDVNCSAAVAKVKAIESDLTIGPIRFAFDRSPANQERVSDDETQVSDYAGIIILVVTVLIILIVIVIIIAGLRNCSFSGESSRVLCPEATSLRQTSGGTPEAELKGLEGLNVKRSRTPSTGSRSRTQQHNNYTLWRVPSTSSSHKNYIRAADDSV